MKANKNIMAIGILLWAAVARPQATSNCLDDILAWEEQVYKLDLEQPNAIFGLHYSVLTEDWDGKVVRSRVKVYRSQEEVHFFSEQADIYQDKDHVFLVLHPQKLILWNDAPEEMAAGGFDEEFMAIRRSFFEESTVEVCGPAAGEPSVKVAVVKAVEDLTGTVLINRMKYRYDTQHKKLLSTEISYKPQYKVKRIVVTYEGLYPHAQYDFGGAAWKHVLKPDGNPLAKFSNYQLMDNR